MSSPFKDPVLWQPRSCDQIAGCPTTTEHYRDLVNGVINRGLMSGFNTLMTGDSRTGKTSGIRMAIRSLTCKELDYDTLMPCNFTCQTCRYNMALHGHVPFFDVTKIRDPLSGTLRTVRYKYFALDCSRLSGDELEDVLFQTGQANEHLLAIVHLDEVHHLAAKKLDERLLKPLEDHKAIWLATSAYVKEEDLSSRTKLLDKMFKNRFTYRLQTERPTVEELTDWLFDRCEEFGILCDDPHPTLTLLAEKCNQITGLALQVLSRAFKKRDVTLTRKMVIDHVFNFDEE